MLLCFQGFFCWAVFFLKHMPVSRISSYNWEENSVLMLKSFLNLCSSGNIVNSSYLSGHYRKCEARACKINKTKGKDKQADNHGLQEDIVDMKSCELYFEKERVIISSKSCFGDSTCPNLPAI